MLAPAVGRDQDELRLALEHAELGKLDHCVMGEGAARLTLTTSAVAAVHEHGKLVHAIADCAASASAIQGRFNIAVTSTGHMDLRA
jgi:hypothetical protein